MSREGAGGERPKAEPAAGTPIWIGIVYLLGAVGAVLLGFLLLLKLATAFFWDDPPSYDPSLVLVALWSCLVILAVLLWLQRRRG